MKNILEIRSATNYYHTPFARELSHELKHGSELAAAIMAKQMANLIPQNCTLVPIPSRNGIATTNLMIADNLSEITGLPVVDAIRGVQRESLYDIKKRGDRINKDFFGYFLSRAVNTNNVVLIDGVFDTGTTAHAASKLFKDMVYLVAYSRTVPSL